jgi:hypothetical protein
MAGSAAKATSVRFEGEAPGNVLEHRGLGWAAAVGVLGTATTIATT